MNLLFNDLSIHGQFSDRGLFQVAIERVMLIRQIARRFGGELYCHRNVASRSQVTQAVSMIQAIQAFSLDKRRALMQWLTRQGPFWEDTRLHGSDDYLKFNEDIVTDSAVGEAAYCCFHGVERHLVSLDPSEWTFSPVSVTWISDPGAERNIEVLNHWEPGRIETVLHAAPVPITSWKGLEQVAIARCPALTFSPDSFQYLVGYPFVPSAAERILVLLDTLQRFRSCRDEDGHRTPEGQRLYQNHFTGDKAWFTDSSVPEKHRFRAKLTFQHPTAEGQFLFCPWHGKVKTPQIRIHFTWPVPMDQPLFVVYIGPKITKI